MALTTFGAIIKFASDMVKCSSDIYKMAIQAADPAFKESLQVLLAEEEKSHRLMEQTRRENVVEMVLEPIVGLHQEDYETKIEVPDNAQDRGLLKIVLALEEREKKFFADSAAKVPLPEVARIFRKIAKTREKHLAELNSIGLD